MYTSLGCGRVENELDFSTLLLHGVIVIHGHNSVRIPVGRHPHAEKGVVGAKGECPRTDQRQNGSEEGSFQTHSKVWPTDLGHGADYIPQNIASNDRSNPMPDFLRALVFLAS